MENEVAMSSTQILVSNHKFWVKISVVTKICQECQFISLFKNDLKHIYYLYLVLLHLTIVTMLAG